MHRTSLINTVGRLATVIGILAGLLLLLGTGRVSAEERKAPRITAAFSNGPRMITLGWLHQEEGIYGYAVQVKEAEQWLDGTRLDHTFEQFTLTGLEPETWYILRVCAVYDPTNRTEDECSEPEVRVQTMPLPGRPANNDPPTIIDYAVTPDAIKVFWGPTGDYTRILVHLSDPDGNVDQREVSNTPNGSHTFEGLRAGVRYRVILKGCSLTLLGISCGSWSPDVFIPTPRTPEEPPPPSKPTLKVTRDTPTTVVLDFSVQTRVVSDVDRFLVFRDGVQVKEVMPRAGVGGYTGSYPDQTVGHHRYQVCFKQRAEPVCSDPVSSVPVIDVQQRFPVPLCRILPQGCDEAPLVLPYGPDTCKDGYVWREAFEGDTVCVTPQTRAQAAADNAQATARREPNGGPYGPDTCRSGYVWREARPSDLVCVTPETRAQTAADNAVPNQHRVVPR